MPTLRPIRDYNEKDVIPFFSFSGTLPTNRGTLVKIQRGYVSTDEPIEMIGNVGNSYNNTVSQRYGSYAKVATAGAGDNVIGMLLKDVRETDENGELLKFNPIKAAEMDVVLSGQSCPIVTKGRFLYSGALLASQTPAAQTRLYPGVSGEVSTGVSGTSLGYALGGKDTNGCVMVHIDIY